MCGLLGLGVWRFRADKSLSQRNFLVRGLTRDDRYTAVPGCSWYEYRYRGTTVVAWDARVVPIDLAYVIIFIDFLALGVLRVCFCC